jgi:hypothetical protein
MYRLVTEDAELSGSPGAKPDPATPDAASPEAATPARRKLRPTVWVYAVLLCVAGGLGSAAVFRTEPLLSANDRSRWATVRALVEQGTYRIDDVMRQPGWDTIDKVRHDGHFYSSKPPLLATLVAGVAYGVEWTTGWNIAEDTTTAARYTLLVVNVLPMLLALVALAMLVERYAETDAARIFLFTAAAFGTYLSTYVVTLNNHTVAAVSVILALYPLLRIWIDRSGCPLNFALVGFFAAMASANELPAALFGVAAFGMCAVRSPLRTLLAFAPAALIPLAGFFWTNYLVTDGVKPFYAYYGTEKYVYVHDGVPSYWMYPQGIDANTEPPLVYLLHCTVGHHGIFSLTPIFLLTFAGWCLPRTWRSPGRAVQAAGVLLTLAVMAFYLSRTENYNYGGNTAGLRWSFWLIPFWLLAMLPLLDAFGRNWWFRSVAGVLLAASVFSAASAAGNPWRPSWLYDMMKERGLIDYERRPPQFARRLTTWFSSLPDDPARGDWAEFISPNSDGTVMRLRLTDGGRIDFYGYAVRRVVVTWDGGTDRERTETHHIMEERFRDGLRPREFVVWPDSEPAPAEREAAYTFLRNLPASRPYNADHVRYVHTAIRPEAFRCQQAASRVDFKPPGGHRTLSHRSDVWICEQVPFGVLAFETVLRDARSGEPAGYRRFEIVAASRIEPNPWGNNPPPAPDVSVRGPAQR